MTVWLLAPVYLIILGLYVVDVIRNPAKYQDYLQHNWDTW